ncbi:ATP-binding protein [Limnobacter sp.]|uniref:ATP-binding protein n=1 Tax=Limnobacter sp. TaxID=2003368 RepID=UPI002FDFBCD2
MLNTQPRTTLPARHSSLGVLPWLIGLALSACLSSLVLFNSLQAQSNTQRLKTEVHRTVENHAQKLESIVSNATGNLYAIDAFVRQTPNLTQASFEQFAGQLSVENPAIRSLQYAPEGIVQFVTNPALNQTAIGMNLYKHPQSVPYLEEAILTGQAVMEGPRELVQGGQALIIRQPIYKTRAATDKLGLMGFATVLIDFEYIKHQVIEPLEKQGLILRVTHQTPMDARQRHIHGQAPSPAINTVSSTVHLPYGQWTLEAVPKNGWGPKIAIPSYLFVPLLVVAFTLLWLSIREYRSRETLRKACESAQSANELKDKLIANISHEIRTPLSSINSIAIMLGAPSYSDEVQELGKAIKQSSEAVNAIVNDLLDLSKIRQGHFRLQKRDFQLDELIDNTANMLQQQWLQKTTVEPVLLEPRNGSLVYSGDRGRIEQVLQNLISNAYKFTLFGRVSVQFDIQAQNRDTDLLIVEVADTGVGIQAGDAERIFDAFYQVDSSLQKKYNGAGLGLAICRQIVEVMGGTIEVHSQPHMGTHFEFRVPLKHSLPLDGKTNPELTQQTRALLQLGEVPWDIQVQQRLEPDWQVKCLHHESSRDKTLPVHADTRVLIDLPAPYTVSKISWLTQFLEKQEHGDQHIVWLGNELPQVAQEHKVKLLMKPVTRNRLTRAFAKPMPPRIPERDLADGSTLRLLMAEDNALNAKIFRKLLENRGATVSIVSNGADAVALLTSGTATFDAVLMDLQMPVMDGLEATRLIRKHEQLRDLPVYAITGHVSDTMRNECLSIGFTNFITKPFDPELLIEDIQTRLKNHTLTH